MTVRIHDLTTFKSYTVSSREECRDDTDRSAYDMAVMLGDVITMGKVIAEPVR